MFTRKQYINNECSHANYYSQFLTDEKENYIVSLIGEELILKTKNINDLKLSLFERCFLSGINQQMKDLGDYLTLSGVVCINKQACCNWKTRNFHVWEIYEKLENLPKGEKLKVSFSGGFDCYNFDNLDGSRLIEEHKSWENQRNKKLHFKYDAKTKIYFTNQDLKITL